MILGEDKRELHKMLVEIREYLEKELKLMLKDNWQIFPVKSRGIDFVGYVFYHDHVKMRKSIKKNFCRKVARLDKAGVSGKDKRCALSSWLGWAKHCNSKNLLKKVVRDEAVFRVGGKR